MNLDLRYALIAKTILRDDKTSNIGLIITSVEEAINTCLNNQNFGYHHHTVIKQKSIKIYKNLLKYYSIKNLIKNFCNSEVCYIYYNKYHKELNTKASKCNVINLMSLDSIKKITLLIQSKVAK